LGRYEPARLGAVHIEQSGLVATHSGKVVLAEIAVSVGDVVHIKGHNRGYRSDSITLRITRVRSELLSCYNNAWIWLEGNRIEQDGREGPWVQVLARVCGLVTQEANRSPCI
jgi:hypothetical protein